MDGAELFLGNAGTAMRFGTNSVQCHQQWLLVRHLMHLQNHGSSACSSETSRYLQSDGMDAHQMINDEQVPAFACIAPKRCGC